MRTTFWIALGVGVLVAVGAVAWSQGRMQAARPSSTLERDVDEALAQLRELQRQRDRPASAYPRQVPAPSAAADVPSATPTSEPNTPDTPEPAYDEPSAPPEETPPVTDDQVVMDAAFDSELADPEWESEALAPAQASLEQLTPDTSEIRDLTCRGAICRAEIYHRDPAHHLRVIDSAMEMQAPWRGPTVIVRELRGDDVVTIAYLARPGTELPTP